MRDLALPDLLPDMTLYSLTACAHRMSGASRGSQTSVALFGNSRAGLLHDFPSNLDTFCASTGNAYGDPSAVARLTTNLPYFVCFRPPNHEAEFVSLMSSDSYGRFKFRLGLPASPTGGRFPLRACVRCIGGDEDRFGIAYWHRRHQLPGVHFCQDHDEPLMESHLRLDRRRRSVFVLPRDEGVFEKLPTGSRGEKTLIRLAALSADLLDRRPDFLYSAERMRATYVHALRDRGMVTNGGFVRAREFLGWMRSLYASIACRPPYNRIFAHERMEGLLRLVRTPRSDFDTLYHVLLIDALFGSWKLFCKTYSWEDALECGPIAEPSERPTALDPKLLELARRADCGDASVTALCREMGIDLQTAFRHLAGHGMLTVRRRPKILTHGLRTSIVSALRRGTPQREVAKRMGVSCATVDRVCQETPGLHREWEMASFLNKRDTKRERLRSYLQLNPSATRMDVRQYAGSGYQWLKRFDKEWIEAQIRVAPRKQQTPREQRGERINWARRDLECLNALKQIATAKVLIQPGERHQPGVIMRKLPLLSFMPRLDRLPLSKAFVATLLATNCSRFD